MPHSTSRLKASHKIALVITVVLVVYLLAANLLSGTPAETESTHVGTSEKDVSQLIRIEDMQATMHRKHVTLNGATEANRQVRLRAQVEGQIIEVAKREGASLKKGDLIMRIDERDRKAQVAQSKALLEQRRVEYAAAQQLNEKGHYSDVRLAQSTAEFESAKAQLAATEDAYQNTFIRAPFDGVLEQLNVEVGDLVGRGMVVNGDDSVAMVVEYDPILIIGQVPQQRRAELVQDLPVGITLFGNQQFEGEIRHIGSVTNPDTRTFRVEVAVANPDGVIPIGVSAEMRLPAGEEPAYNIPPSVLSQDDEGQVGVKLVDDEGIVRFHTVTLLEDSNEGFWVSGLPERIRLVTTGQNYVSDGQRVDKTSTENSDTE